jgi:hypothetical protein
MPEAAMIAMTGNSRDSNLVKINAQSFHGFSPDAITLHHDRK